MAPNSKPRRRGAPALDPEQRENQLIAKANRLAERQIDEGTASAMVITHYLRQGTVAARLEREKLIAENALLKARAEAIQSTKIIEELYTGALSAMQSYRGEGEDLSDDED